VHWQRKRKRYVDESDEEWKDDEVEYEHCKCVWEVGINLSRIFYLHATVFLGEGDAVELTLLELVCNERDAIYTDDQVLIRNRKILPFAPHTHQREGLLTAYSSSITHV